MEIDTNDITLLCKVVDNYGDIGFVFRLARAINQLRPQVKLRLVVSNLQSFSSMAPQIDPALSEQEFNGWKVLDWNDASVCTREFTENPPQVILECFQCGRPDWLEDILFDKNRSSYVQIVNVEYLTAEEWADDFHLLKSGTRSIYVKKMNFMPGFTPKTGGLVLDEPFMTYVKNRESALKALEEYFSPEELGLLEDKNSLNLVVFSYPRNFDFLVRAICDFKEKNRDSSIKVNVFAARGLSLEPLEEAWKKQKMPFNLIKMPYIPQNQWDALLTLTDFNFIRGEDSFSRACLSGVPFLWHVYVQDEEFQLVKLQAVMERLKGHLSPELMKKLAPLAMMYNMTPGIEPGVEAAQVLSEYSLQPGVDYGAEMEELTKELLERRCELKKGFESFTLSLQSNGNLAQNLLDFLDDLL